MRRRVKIDSNEEAELWGWNWRLGGEHGTSMVGKSGNC